jgi:hypothetical protein
MRNHSDRTQLEVSTITTALWLNDEIVKIVVLIVEILLP